MQRLAGARVMSATPEPHQSPIAGASVNSPHYQLHGAVAVITLDNPPMNGLAHPVRLQIVGAVEDAESDPNVHAIVLIGSARVFSSGADIKEFGTPRMMAEPTLRTVIG